MTLAQIIDQTDVLIRQKTDPDSIDQFMVSKVCDDIAKFAARIAPFVVAVEAHPSNPGWTRITNGRLRDELVLTIEGPGFILFGQAVGSTPADFEKVTSAEYIDFMPDLLAVGSRVKITLNVT